MNGPGPKPLDLGPPTMGPADLDAAGGLRRRVLHNAATTVAGNAWAVIVGAISLPLVLRGIGAEAFGLWVLVQTFSALTGWLSLGDLGLRIASVRAIAGRAATGDRAAANRAAVTAQLLFATIGIVIAAAMLTAGRAWLPAAFRAPAELTPHLRFAIACFALQVAIEFTMAGTQARLEGSQRVDLARAMHAVRQTLIAIATTIAAVQVGTLRSVAFASAAASSLAFVVTLVVAQRRVPLERAAPSWSDARDQFRYGLQVGMVNATGVLHRTMDRLIVGVTFGPAPVALVEIATQIQNGVQSILTASAYTTTATAPWLHARSEGDRLRGLLVRGTKLSILVTLPAAAVAIVLAAPLVRAWMGPDHASAAGLTAVATIAVVMAAPLQVGSLVLQGVGHVGVVLRAAIAAVVVNLLASLALVHVTGVVGVFQATLLGSLVLAVPLTRGVLRVGEVSGHEFWRRAVAPTLLPAVAATFGAAGGLLVGRAWPSLLLGTVLAGVAWAATSWRCALDDDDRLHLREAISVRRNG